MSDEIKKGLMGIVVDETTISQVMPEINSLTYRGYKVQDLCEKCIFEEVAYLVLNGELPRSKDLKKFVSEEKIATYFEFFSTFLCDPFVIKTKRAPVRGINIIAERIGKFI